MRLAIVIPTLDEATVLASALGQAFDSADLVVVSDGGSTDATREVATEAGAIVCLGPAGRGAQLSSGADAALDAGAEALLFLHADTRLPSGWRPRIEAALEAGRPGGGFELRFDSSAPWFRLGERFVNARTRLLRVPLGDQAHFCSAAAYRALGGYQPWPILEDVDFMRRMKRLGRPAVIEAKVTTATRRFAAHGTLRTVATNWTIWLLYGVGVSPYRLARLYPGQRALGARLPASEKTARESVAPE